MHFDQACWDIVSVRIPEALSQQRRGVSSDVVGLIFINFYFSAEHVSLGRSMGPAITGAGRFVSYFGPAVNVRSSIDLSGVGGQFGARAMGGMGQGCEVLTSSSSVKRGKDPLSLRSSLAFAAATKTSADPLGARGPSVYRGEVVQPYGVYVPPSAKLWIALRLISSSPSETPLRFACVTPGPHHVYFGMEIICQGTHFADPAVSYVITRLVGVDEAKGRVGVEVRGFNSMTRAEVHGPYIVEFIQKDVVLAGFLGMSFTQVLRRLFCVPFWVGLRGIVGCGCGGGSQQEFFEEADASHS